MTLTFYRSFQFFFLLSLTAQCLISCGTDHVSPPNQLQSANLLPPTTSGPSGQAYAMQIGTKCFLLDEQQKFWLYDPVARSYTAKASPPELPNKGASFTRNLYTFSSKEKIYLGGQGEIAIPGTNNFPVFLYVYDPETNLWISANPKPGNGIPQPDGHISFFADGKGYVCFFVNEVIDNTRICRIYGNEYDPATGQWIERFNTPLILPPGLTYGGPSLAVVINEKAYWAVNAYPTTKIGKSLNSEDGFTCIYELVPQTNDIALKLTTTAFGAGMDTSPDFRLGLSAANKLWLMNEGSFDKGNPIANELFWYDPVTNQFNRTSAKLLIGPNKFLFSPVGFATNDRLYIGLGAYSFANATPAGLENGFAEFNVK